MANNTPVMGIGTVEDYNPVTHTADVDTLSLGYLTSIAVLNTHGTTFGKDIASLNSLRGSQVVIAMVEGNYVIIGTLPTRVSESITEATVETPEALLTGLNPNAYPRVGLHNFSAGRPQGMLPGDKVLRADDGETELGLYKGGIVRLRASSMAQFLLGKIKDFFRLIARTGQIFTDFGEIKFTHNDSGRVGMQILGGAEYATETHPNEEAWTVKVYLGNDPGNAANRLYIEVTDPTGFDKSTIAMDNAGKIDITSTGTCTIDCASKLNLEGASGVDVDGGSGGETGVVTGESFCPFIGAPHPDKSSDVKASHG